VHTTSGTNCFTDGRWDPSLCPDPETCGKNCALDGNSLADLSSKYGVSVIDGGIQENYQAGLNVGSRMYLMETESTYKMFNLKNKEFTFDVELSTLPCGINAALYFVEMAQDGGMSTSGGMNSAGARYGTGYCDAQCPGDVKFVNGKGNMNTNDPFRVCCAEMDIWEGNSICNAVTPHPAACEGATLCEGSACNSTTDKSGCDFNAYREGEKSFYGPGSSYTVDASRPLTVVTQFVTSDGTDHGDLAEIRRFYFQDGKYIPNSVSKLGYSSLSDQSCAAQNELFGDPDVFGSMGGMKSMGDAFERGMVLVFSIWDDAKTNMNWLDSVYPPGSSGPGAERGPCSPSSGDPSQLRPAQTKSYVKYYNVKYGEFGTTHPPTPSPTPTPMPTPPPTPTPTPPIPTPTPFPTPTPIGEGVCCFDAETCDVAKGDPHSCTTGGFCGTQSHCEGDCKGIWCDFAAPDSMWTV